MLSLKNKKGKCNCTAVLLYPTPSTRYVMKRSWQDELQYQAFNKLQGKKRQ